MTANQRAVDVYTVGHFAVGFLGRRVGIPPLIGVLAAGLWEIGEDDLKRALPSWFPESAPDSKRNAIVDLAAFVAGYVMGGQ